MNSRYRIITNPNLEDVEFEVGDLVLSEVTNYLDSAYGWFSPEQIGMVKEVSYLEVTDYYNSNPRIHKVCELKIYWPKTGKTSYATSNMVIKLKNDKEGESDVDI